MEEIKEKPLMVACTGFLNSQIELEAEKAGFDVSIQAPLTVEKIDSCIRERLRIRTMRFENIASLSFYDQPLEEEEKG